MHLSVKDKSNYFRGLLLLVRKDNKITEEERKVLMSLGKSLGFEEKYCRQSIASLLDNKFIAETPPKFSSSEIALNFLADGLRIAESGTEICSEEKHWLRSVAEANAISEEDLNEIFSGEESPQPGIIIKSQV